MNETQTPRKRLLAPAHLRASFWLFSCSVLALSLLPTSHTLPTTGWDKSNHLSAFFLLTMLGLLAYPAKPRITMIALVAYGGMIEVLQSFTAYRFAEWGDLLADAIGVCLGGLLTATIQRRRKR